MMEKRQLLNELIEFLSSYKTVPALSPLCPRFVPAHFSTVSPMSALICPRVPALFEYMVPTAYHAASNQRRLMPKISVATVALASVTVLASAQAQVYKCVDAQGRVAFSDQPCIAAQQSSQLMVPAVPPVQASVPAQTTTRAMSPEATAHEAARQQKRADSNASHHRIAAAAAAAQVHQLREDNADPAKCAAARARMAQMQRREPITYKLNVSYFEFEQQAGLYCGNEGR